jgi:hypothetical protein
MSNTIFKSIDVSVAVVRYAWWPFFETQWIEFFFVINGFIINKFVLFLFYVSSSGLYLFIFVTCGIINPWVSLLVFIIIIYIT